MLVPKSVIKSCIYNRFRNISSKLRDVLLIRDVTAVSTNRSGEKSDYLWCFRRNWTKFKYNTVLTYVTKHRLSNDVSFD